MKCKDPSSTWFDDRRFKKPWQSWNFVSTKIFDLIAYFNLKQFYKNEKPK